MDVVRYVYGTPYFLRTRRTTDDYHSITTAELLGPIPIDISNLMRGSESVLAEWTWESHIATMYRISNSANRSTVHLTDTLSEHDPQRPRLFSVHTLVDPEVLDNRMSSVIGPRRREARKYSYRGIWAAS